MGKFDSVLMATIGAFIVYFGYLAYMQQILVLPAALTLFAFGALMVLFGLYSFQSKGGAQIPGHTALLYKAKTRVPSAPAQKAGGVPLQGAIEAIVNKLTSQTLLIIALGLILLFVLALYSKSTDTVIIAITLILLAVISKARDFQETVKKRKKPRPKKR